jgi:hypothetical protein
MSEPPSFAFTKQPPKSYLIQYKVTAMKDLGEFEYSDCPKPFQGHRFHGICGNYELYQKVQVSPQPTQCNNQRPFYFIGLVSL